MALPAPNLDDRNFQDIVDEAKRLIPRYCPEWTNHNLSDPGVALIELFAWMSEMVMYRLNQVPDRLYVKFLDLVGIEPFPPSVATTHLTFWLSTVLGHAVTVPAASEVATPSSGTGEDVIFSTLEDLVISPPTLFGAKTGRADRRPALHRRLGQTCASRAARSSASPPSPSPRGTPSTSASRRARGAPSCGCRSRPPSKASASTHGIRPSPGRPGAASCGSPPPPRATPPAA